MKATLVIGASENPERYAYKAIQALVKHGHAVTALGNKVGNVSGIEFETQRKIFSDIHTVTLYVGPANQVDLYDYVIQIKPQRVIFNPGTENPVFEDLLTQAGIEVERACTLVLLASNQF